MTVGICRSGAPEIAPLGPARQPILHPDLVNFVAPISEKADTGAARRDRVEVVEQCIPAQALEHALAHLVARFDVECQARDGSERAQSDDESLEIGVASRCPDNIAAGSDQLHTCDGCRQVAIDVAGAVRSGGDRARHRDVRKRGQVVQGHAFGIQRLGQPAVRESGADCHGARCVVNGSFLGQCLEQQELRRIGDARERMPRAEHPQTRAARDDLAHLFQGGRAVQLAGQICVRAGPVRFAHSLQASSQVEAGIGRVTDSQCASSQESKKQERKEQPGGRHLERRQPVGEGARGR